MHNLPTRLRHFHNALTSLEQDTPAIEMMRRNAAIIRSQRDPEPELDTPLRNQCTGGMAHG